MELRFYIVEKIGTGTEQDPIRPNRIGDIVGLRFATMDYGLENLMLVGAWTSAAQHAALSAQSDVYVVPPLGQAVGGNPVLNQTRNRIEGFGLPGQWILATTTYREIIGKTGHFCMLSQRLRGLASKRLYEPGMNLGSSITAAYAEQLRQVGQSLNLDPSVVTTGMTLRAALHALEAQMPGFMLAEEWFTGRLPPVFDENFEDIPMRVGQMLQSGTPTLVASDDFERGTPGTDTPIGPNWTASVGDMRILNGRVRGWTALNNYLFWNANTFHANQRSQVRWVDSGFDPSNGPTCRFNAAGNGYTLVLRSSNLAPIDIRVARIDANAFTLLQTLPGLPQHQTNYALQATSNELRAFHEGVQFGSVVTDATHATGQPGMRNFGASGWLDDWVGSNVTTALVDTGLVVRYYFDEAASGVTPTLALDKSGIDAAMDLDVIYAGSMSYAEIDGNRGLHSTNATGTHIARRAISSAGRVYAAIQDSQRCTIEFVAHASQFHTGGSRIFGLNDSTTSFGHGPSVSATAANTWQVRVNDAVRETFNGGSSERAVFHVVIDTTLGTNSERIKVYKNGVLISSTVASALAQNETIQLRATGMFITALNRPDQLRPLGGRVFYGALYNVAFTQADVTNNYAILIADDDAPDASPPGEITDLVATPASGQINLAWTPASGAASHRIERRTVS